MKKLFKHIITFLFVFITGTVFAQYELLDKAQEYIGKNKPDSALLCVNKALEDPELAKDHYVWYVKGFAIKEICKQKDVKNSAAYRAEAIKALKKSLELDVNKQYAEKTKKVVNVIATQYYNEAVRYMDTLNYKMAIENYEHYKNAKLIVEPTANFKEQDALFYSNLAGVYRSLYESNKDKNYAFFELAIANYQKSADIIPTDDSPYYNIGSLYYNQGASIMMKVDYEIDLVAFDQKQEEAIVYFKKGLPFLLKAYSINPQKIPTVESLEGIYHILLDMEKSEKYKQEKKKLQGN